MSGTPVAHEGSRRCGVDVWVACFADLRELPSPWWSWLDGRERAMLARLTPRAAIGYAGRRAMLRTALSLWSGVPAGRIRFREGPFGKPELDQGAKAPRFSLSRSGELGVAAVSADEAVGVDIEEVGSFEAGVVRLFAAEEQAALARLPPAQRAPAFFRAWVCKEASLKATGLGLTVPLDAVLVVPANDAEGTGTRPPARPRRAIVTLDPARATITPDAPRRYHARFFQPRPGIVGAVATPHPAPVRLRWWRRCQRRAACSACTISLRA